MIHPHLTRLVRLLAFVPVLACAQGTLADYERANGLRERNQALAVNLAERATWIDKTSRFWYRKSVKDGHEFVLVDATTLAKTPAFDHKRLAAALAKASGEKVAALKLPFLTLTFVEELRAIEFAAFETRWKADLKDYVCHKLGPVRGFSRRAGLPQTPPPATGGPQASPDGKWEALIVNYNVHLRPKGKREGFELSFDGSEGNSYEGRSISWAPDSKKLAAYRTRPGYHRKIQYIESSPEDQLQPKYSSLEYAKPGDAVDIQQPVLFEVESRRQTIVANALFPNPYQLSRPVWWKDSRGFTFEYNQRGHQVYRVIEVEAATGRPRALISEEPKTFFCYSGKKFRQDLDDGGEIVWMSERDGWNHLYLYDGAMGKVKAQITRGNWVVRGVEKVDEERRQVYFRASGMYPGRDPYFVHYYRINLDGSALTPLTEADANHAVSLSPDLKYYVDTWSRLDLPPVAELRLTADRKTVAEIERGNIDDLRRSGWRPPEVFTSLGRDGKTDIWGILLRPSNFNPSRKYPVIEFIYAGPQDSFVPKSFSPYFAMQSLAELGFIVVQIDGMGTSNRSKAFHDVCWKNLADAGFPDRILWHKAVAAKYSFYDITRVGIYGHSAGGQNALGALLFHPEFYKAAVASCGCHDNRMDKIWWNEQWMGWPLGPEYIACSNSENAARLKGKLLLSVGELDNNVDPASTLQVASALIKANKTFEFLMLPGQGHSPGGAYGDRKRYDFFVHHLLRVEPPEWNVIDKKPEQEATSQ
ncbi:MAG: DPP IV N-terminal domain-containing protein [Candidatus Solibacter usitatus]|nr:DPP IV N-terminal domain-containing protein [Candidatus Solibacter usitatus]